MPRRKAFKNSRTRGRGHKKGRGAGLRGGRGNAGCHKTKRIMYERVGRVSHLGHLFDDGPLTSPLVPPSLAISASIVISSPPVGESSLKLIPFMDKSGSFSSANVFIAEKGNISMASNKAVILRDIFLRSRLGRTDIKVSYTLRV